MLPPKNRINGLDRKRLGSSVSTQDEVVTDDVKFEVCHSAASVHLEMDGHAAAEPRSNNGRDRKQQKGTRRTSDPG